MSERLKATVKLIGAARWNITGDVDGDCGSEHDACEVVQQTCNREKRSCDVTIDRGGKWPQKLLITPRGGA